MKKRILSIVLVLAMVLSLFPAAIFATEEDAVKPEEFTVADDTEFKNALTAEAENIVINLDKDVTYDVAAWQNNAMGGAKTETITINGNGKTITFNQTNSDWNNIVTDGAKLIINNAKLTNSGKNDGPWNRHDLNFGCVVELNNVVSDKAMAFKNSAALNTVTIDDANTSDTYAIWIQPNVKGQIVTLDNCTIDMLDCTDGRGIKIDNQYVAAAAEQKVTLEVKNTTFKTEEKSAILVKSTVGADVIVSNITISDVAADNEYAVWVDEATAAYYDLVNVSGALMKIEGRTPVAAIDNKHYATLADAIAAAEDWDVVELLQDVALTETLVINTGKIITIYGNGHKITNNGATNTALMVGDTTVTKDADLEDDLVYVIENVVFDGWNTDHVIRVQGVNAKIENCTFQNCKQTSGLGLVTYTFANGAVLYSTFQNNTCVKAIDVNSWGDGSQAIVNIDGCTFEKNVCSSTGVVEAIAGELVYLTNCKFADNSAQSVVVFIATDSEVTGNSFVGNTVANTKGNEASILAGPWVKKAEGAEYAIVINNNSFQDTGIPGVCVEEYGVNAAYDLNNNYWGGVKTNYLTWPEDKTPVVTLDDWYVDEAMTILNSSLKDVVTEIPGTDDESDTKVTVDHAPVVEETKKEDVKVENVVVPEDSDMTPEQAEQAAKELHEAVTEIKVEAEQIAAEQAANVTVEEITEAVTKIEEKLGADQTVTNVTVETKVSLEVKVEEAVLAAPEAEDAEEPVVVKSLTVNITPVVTTTITGETETGAKEVVTTKENAKAEVKIPVTVRIPLPAKYFKVGDALTIIHTKGNGDENEKFYHPVTVAQDASGLYVEFLNENGFSEFKVAPSYKVDFVDADGKAITNEDVTIKDAFENEVAFSGTLPDGNYVVTKVKNSLCLRTDFAVAGKDITVEVLSVPVAGTALEGYSDKQPLVDEIYKILAPYMDDEQTIKLAKDLYAALTNDGIVDNAEFRQIAKFVYFDVLAVTADAPAAAVAGAGSSSSGSGSLTPAQKVAILEDIYDALETNGALDTATYPELGAVKELYDTLTDVDAEGDQIVPDAVLNDIFDKIVAAAVENEEITEDVIASVTTDVANTLLTDERIKPENKVVIMEEVAESLKEVGAGTVGALPTDVLDVVKDLRAALKASGYFTDAQLGEIIEDITKLAMDGSFDRDTARLADKLHNNLLGRDDLTAQDKAEIVGIVYTVLEEKGLVEYGIMGALAYAYLEAVNKGYLDAAIFGLGVAIDSIGVAKNYVNANVPAEYETIRDLMIEELDNTADTLGKLETLLKKDPTTVTVADLLALEEDLWAHLDTLKELGLAAGVEIDPYLKKLNDAVVEFNGTVQGIIDDAYAIISAVKSFPEAYAAWVEEVGAKVDAISPELGALVRKYLNDNAADAMAILAVYGDEAVTKLVSEAVAAYGEIADVVMDLFYVLSIYGEDIYAAVENNDEVKALVEAIKAQLAEAKELVEWIDEHPFEGAYNAVVADKQAALDKLYAELAIHYNKLYALVVSVIADVDEDAANALCDSLKALKKVLCISYNAGEGYLGWLSGHAEAMACELLCALLDNTWEFVVAASPIVDQVMYDWLYTHPYEVIEFCSENAAEIEALIEKYGPAVVGVLAYIGYTYGPEVLEFVIENPCESVDMFMDWYNKYGYRIWPMIDVYLEALGVYDAIDHQLGVVNQMLMDLLADVDAHILAQIAALKEALKDAEGELREQILAQIAALNEYLMNVLKSNISANYVVSPNSYYVALGDSGAYGPAADMLAKELGMSNRYANLTAAGVTASDVLDNLAAYAAEIDKADLITLGFSANSFTAAVAADVLAAAGLGMGEVSEKDWAALVGEYGAEAVAAALAELTAYVTEEVGDESIAALLTLAVEGYAYAYITHLVDYVILSEAIHEINAEALLVLVGMHNAMDGVVVALGEEAELDLGEYLDYLVTVTNIFTFGYALIADETIYVDAPAVELGYNGEVVDIMTFVTDLANMAYGVPVEKYEPTEAGYKYIQEQIYNALNPTLMGLLGDVNSDGYVDTLDAMLILRWDAELIGANDLNLNVGDVNADGFVDSVDSMLILRLDAELIEKLPAA